MLDRSILDNAYRKDINTIKLNKNNTFNHEMIKASLGYILLNNKHDFYTEAIFKNGKRADILDMDEEVAIEVLDSERLFNISIKQKFYPVKIWPVEIDDYVKIRLLEIRNWSYGKLWKI